MCTSCCTPQSSAAPALEDTGLLENAVLQDETVETDVEDIPHDHLVKLMERPQFQIGDELRAKDRVGNWYEAKVVDQRVGFHYQCQLKIHFKGWKARFDEWVDAEDGTRLMPSSAILSLRAGKRARQKPDLRGEGRKGRSRSIGGKAKPSKSGPASPSPAAGSSI